MSRASIVAALFAPCYPLLLWGVDAATLPIAVMGMLLVWRHFPNIQRLIAGTESRLGRKPAAEVAAKPPAAHHPPHKAHKKGHS